MVIDGRHVVTLSAALPARLPAETLQVSFGGPSGEQTHTETGPALLEAPAAAGIRPTLNTWVAAVGDDNYVATVTPAAAVAQRRRRHGDRATSRYASGRRWRRG